MPTPYGGPRPSRKNQTERRSRSASSPDTPATAAGAVRWVPPLGAVTFWVGTALNGFGLFGVLLAAAFTGVAVIGLLRPEWLDGTQEPDGR